MSQSQGKSGNGKKWVPAQNATNYILCHIRKVVYKKGSSDEEEEKVSSIEEEPERENEEEVEDSFSDRS